MFDTTIVPFVKNDTLEYYVSAACMQMRNLFRVFVRSNSDRFFFRQPAGPTGPERRLVLPPSIVPCRSRPP